MAVNNYNTQLFSSTACTEELSVGGACGHQAELDLAINPEVAQIINSQFFAGTVRTDRGLDIQTGDHLTLNINAHQLGVRNDRTGATKFFDIAGTVHQRALQKAEAIWQRHLAEHTHSHGGRSLFSSVAPLPYDETLRAQAAQIAALQEQIAQMVPADEQLRLQGLLYRAPTTDQLAELEAEARELRQQLADAPKIADLEELREKAQLATKEQARLQDLVDKAPTTAVMADLERQRAEAAALSERLKQQLADAPKIADLEELREKAQLATKEQARLQDLVDKAPTTADMADLERQRAEAAALSERLEQQLAEAPKIADLDDLRRQAQRATEEQARLQGLVDKAPTTAVMADLERQRAEAAALSERLEQQLAEAPKIADLDDLRRQAQRATEEQARLQGLVDKAPTTEAMDALKERLAEAAALSERLEQQLAEAPSAKRLAELERLLEENAAAYESVVAAKREEEARSERLGHQLQSARLDTDLLQYRIEGLEVAVAKAQAATEAAQQELYTAQEKLEDMTLAHSEAAGALEIEKEGRFDDLRRQQAKVRALEAQAEKARGMFTRAAADADLLRKELQEQTALRATAERSAEAATRAARSSDAEVRRLQKRDGELVQAADQARSRSQVLERRVAHLTTEVSDLREVTGVLAAEVEKRDRENDALLKRQTALATDRAEFDELGRVADEALDELDAAQKENAHLRALLEKQEAVAARVAETEARLREEAEAGARPATPPGSADTSFMTARSSDGDDELDGLADALEALNHTFEQDADDEEPADMTIRIGKRYETALKANCDLLNLGKVNENTKLESQDLFLIRKYAEAAGIVRKNDPKGHSGTNYNAWRKGTFARLNDFFQELQAGLSGAQGDGSNLGQLLLQPRFPFFAVELLAYENLLQKVAATGDTKRAEFQELARTLRSITALRVQLTQLVNNVATRAEYV
jgi:hypothetical protein